VRRAWARPPPHSIDLQGGSLEDFEAKSVFPQSQVVSEGMTAWRTDPNRRLSAAADLAEKFKDLGWRRLYRSEQRRIRQNPDEVCQHLASQHIKSLAEILKIPPPARKSKAPLPSRGKDALMERIRATHRASRGENRTQNG
jgi:hypothetical protein